MTDNREHIRATPMRGKSDAAVHSINKQLGEQSIYLLKKIIDQAFSIGGFDRVLVVVGDMLQECKRTNGDAGALVATDWALKQLDSFAPEHTFESMVVNLELALRAARDANSAPAKRDANESNAYRRA